MTSHTRNKPLTVVGAGVMGTALAVAWARAGRKVDVFDVRTEMDWRAHTLPVAVVQPKPDHSTDAVSSEHRICVAALWSEVEFLRSKGHQIDAEWGTTGAGWIAVPTLLEAWRESVEGRVHFHMGISVDLNTLDPCRWLATGGHVLPAGVPVIPTAGMMLVGPRRSDGKGIQSFSPSPGFRTGLTQVDFLNRTAFGSTFERLASPDIESVREQHEELLFRTVRDVVPNGISISGVGGWTPWMGLRSSLPDARPVAGSGYFLGGGPKAVSWSWGLAQRVVHDPQSLEKLFGPARFVRKITEPRAKFS